MSSTRDSLNRAQQAATNNPTPFKTTATAAELGRITVNLGDLFRPFKAGTAMEGTSMTDVIRSLVSQWVDEHPIK